MVPTFFFYLHSSVWLLSRWNVSVGQVELSLEEGDELNEDWEFCDGSDAVHDWQLQLVASEGLVYAYSNTDAKFLWSHQVHAHVLERLGCVFTCVPYIGMGWIMDILVLLS